MVDPNFATMEEDVLRVVKYFDFFHYPLTAEEIWIYFPKKIDQPRLNALLASMVRNQELFQFDRFYTVRNAADVIARRLAGNQRAAIKIKKAYKIARFINRFPFIDTVLISGSLSKNYADDKTDMDFFIVTKPNKVWIARTILHLFKKLTYIAGRQHDFCMNYFIDVKKLKIEEQNIFTAIELATLKSYRKTDITLNCLLAENDWLSDYIPNFYSALAFENVQEKKTSFLYRLIFENSFFNFINTKLMVFTDQRWQKKWRRKKYPMIEYPLAFKTKYYVSKNHPGNYQKKVLEALDNV